jgi:hypothetical protein
LKVEALAQEVMHSARSAEVVGIHELPQLQVAIGVDRGHHHMAPSAPGPIRIRSRRGLRHCKSSGEAPEDGQRKCEPLLVAGWHRQTDQDQT